MQRRNLFIFVGLLTLLTIIPASTPFAAVPKLVNFQAQLSDASGTPLDGTYSMRFSLYDDPSIGAMQWGEVQDVTVAAGILDVLLGSVTPFSGTEFAGSRPLFIQIDIYNAGAIPASLGKPYPAAAAHVGALCPPGR